jgi:hypothetical protein
LTHQHDKHDHKYDQPTGGPSSAEVEAGLADPAPEGLDALAPEILRLPGREPIDVRGRSVADVIGMIRDACGAPDPGAVAPSVKAGPTREQVEEERSEVPSEPLSPDDVVITDETTTGNWIIIGCGDEEGERGFIVEGTVRPSPRGTSQKPKKGES